jgi:hypothetical protein
MSPPSSWSKKISEVKRKHLCLLVSCFASASTLKMEATWSSETSVDFQRTTRRLEDRTLHNHRCENLKSVSFELLDLGQLAELLGRVISSSQGLCVSATDDCEDGEVGAINGFGRGNRSTRIKPGPTSYGAATRDLLTCKYHSASTN